MIHDSKRLLVGDVIVERVQEFQAFEVRHRVKMDDGLSVAFADGQFVLQAFHHVCHFREVVKVLQLFEHFYGFFHDLIVVFRQRHVKDGIVGVCIAVVFAIIHLYRGHSCLLA